jgi:arsenate reductase-like glutaredoxin family protein
LRQAGIAFNDRVLDDSKEAQAMFARLKEDSVPVLVSEKGLVVGFNAETYAAVAKDAAH